MTNKITINELWHDSTGQYCAEIDIDGTRIASVYSPRVEMILVNSLRDQALRGLAEHPGPQSAARPVSAPLLSQAGAALMGPQWQAPLARALGVNLRTMQRWAAGDGEPSAAVWADIRKLLAVRKSEIARLLRSIP